MYAAVPMIVPSRVLAVELRVARAMNFAHPARAEGSEDVV
jgi:hypothetical protein